MPKKVVKQAVKKASKKNVKTILPIAGPDRSLCLNRRPPFRDETAGHGYRRGEGTGGITFGLLDNHGSSNLATGALQIHTELYHFSNSDVTNHSAGFHTHFIAESDTYTCLHQQATGLKRMKFTVTCVIDKLTHKFNRHWLPNTNRSSSISYLTEFHIMLPGTNEILKFELARRSYSGWTNFTNNLDLVPPGTVKTFVATTTNAYPVRNGVTYHIGLYSDHHVTAQNVFISSIGEASIRVTNLVICAVV